MDLHVLFIQAKESYPGQFAPEAALVIDEYSLAEDPEGFEGQVEAMLASYGDVAAHAVVRIRVDQDKIRELLDKPVVDGEIHP